MRRTAPRRIWECAVLAWALLITVSVSAATPAGAAETDPFAAVREKWVTSIVGDGPLDLDDPDVSRKVAAVTDAAQKQLARLDRSSTRSSVFTHLATRLPNQNITQSFIALREIAVAYRMDGSALHDDPSVRADVVDALVWIEQNWYNAEVAFAPQSPDNNWFAWELGVPLALTDVLALMYDDLPLGLLDEYVAAIDHFLPRPDRLGHSVTWNLASEGANLAWAVTALSKRGVLGQDADVITRATQALSPLFDYAAEGGNGFHPDGSVLFHEGFPYTTGYGWSNVIEPTLAVMLYEDSPWEITDSDKTNLIRWVKDSFEPFLFGNRIHDSLAGRNIARPRGQDRASGLINLALDLRSLASTEDAAHLESLVKYMLSADPGSSFWRSGSVPNIVDARRILDDPAIAALEPAASYRQFPAMDRSVARREGWSFGVAMHSSRTQNYESINNENVRGWHTADGRTTLYTADADQYGDDYWPTIDATRIPGTTVVEHLEEDVLAPQIGRVELQGAQPLVDDLADLSGAHYRSPRWTTVTDSVAPNGDTTAVRRTENSQEQITFRASAAVTSFTIDVHHTEGSGLERLVVMASTNDSGYAPVKLTASAVAESGEWVTSVVRPQGALPAGTKFVRIHLMPSVPQAYGKTSWVGGAELDGTYGVSGMELRTPGTSLVARKSWFVLDEEVVAVGSGISATDGRAVETIVDNRRLSDAFPGRLTVEGEHFGAEDGSRELDEVRWANLGEGISGSDIGYVFPGGADIRSVHETRSADWSEIGNSALAAKNRFASLVIDHGEDPQNSAYSYVLLPGADAAKTAAYSDKPEVEIIAQRPELHAIHEAETGILGATVWTNEPTSVELDGEEFLQVTGQSAVLMRESAEGLTIAVSDPTQGADRAGPIDDPANGFSMVHERSANWGLEPGGGFKRMAATTEFLTYKVDEARDFLVTLRWNHQASGGNTSDILDRIRFSVSPDNATWSPVEVALTAPHTPVDGGGLSNTADVAPIAALPAGSQYVRMEILDKDPKIWSPQIRHVRIDSGAPDGAYVDVQVSRSAASVLEHDPRVEVVSLDPVTLRVNVDGAGGQTLQARLAYDVMPPSVTADAPRFVWEGEEHSMTVAAVDDSGTATIEVTKDGAPVSIAADGTVNLDVGFGVHDYVVAAIDRQGNRTENRISYQVLRFVEEPPRRDAVKHGSTLPVRFRVEAPRELPDISATFQVVGGPEPIPFDFHGGTGQVQWRSGDVGPGLQTLRVSVTADGYELPAREREVTVRG